MTADRDTREIELKFRARAGDLAAVKRAVNSAAPATPKWTTKRLVSRYFDTADRQLARNGAALRLRTNGDKIVQTLKTATVGSGDMLTRREWEFTVPSPALDLDGLPQEARRALGAVSEADLAPGIEVAYQRQTTTLRRTNPIGPDLVVEVALDKGVAVAGGKTERFAECEMELLDGDVDAFFRLAAEVHDACPLPLSRLSKA